VMPHLLVPRVVNLVSEVRKGCAIARGNITHRNGHEFDVDLPDGTQCVLVSQPHPFGNNNAICYVLLIMFVYKNSVDTLCLRRP
jgi:hypothetical protein